MFKRILALFGLAAAFFPATTTPAGPLTTTNSVRFNRDVRPIFSENCYACHGPDKNARKAKLRLDSPEDPFADHEGTIPIIPGKPDESELWTRISSADPEEVMPPPKPGKKLTPQQIQTLREWIAQGARYEGHWAFSPPARPALPENKNVSWCRNPIDNFILARLEKEALTPSPEADRRTLIRRVCFDLTGLPPEPAQAHAFMQSRDPAAYEKLVDLLLASPHYGERMAVYWLDLVRYADTVGYHGDMTYSVWPFRDYVIQAFNRNLPYDQFTREQLAGDLLPDATREQKVASGYNRLNRISTEGGVQDKEYLAKYAADRVRTTSAIWMGATMGCAECHDHKFDPFKSKDFYRFAAFFADLKEKGFYPDGFSKDDWGPRLMLPSASEEGRLKAADEEIASIRKGMEKIDDADLRSVRDRWEDEVFTADKSGALEWTNQAPITLESSGGSSLEIQTNGSVWVSGKNPDHDDYVVTIPGSLERITGLRLEILKDEALSGNQVARAGVTFMLAEVSIVARDKNRSRQIPISRVLADYAQEGFPALAMLDGNLETGWAQGGGPPKDRRAAFIFDSPLSGGSNTTLTVTLKHGPNFPRQHIGRFRLALTDYNHPGPDKNQIPEDVLKSIRLPHWERKPDQEKVVVKFFRSIAAELQPLQQRLAAAEASRSLVAGKIPFTLVSEHTSARPVRVLPRGNWMDDSGEIVQPGVPQFMRQISRDDGPSTRLDLADWLVAKDNPLTARVFVNRLWRMFFGIGLSRTLDDLGAQGEWPTHPELLDWLAVEFVESGWDIKHMVRLIVTSQAYRQKSETSPTLEERDPFNRLMARQSRLRLDAEAVRDTALLISGLLVDKQGGPSSKPYQPENYYAPLNFPKREYVPDLGEGLYRRGLYTHWQRTFLHPSLLAFDAPSREECTVNRVTSNTPLQALVLLNDITYAEAARALAERILRHGGEAFIDRLDWAFQQALSRHPSSAERNLLEEFYQKQLARFRADFDDAKQLIRVGNAPVANDLPPAELAAWTSVARALLNLHETITRN